MKVSLVIREGTGNDRHYSKFNKKKIYPEGTVFCLRYQRKFETLKVTDQTAALAARAIKEAALLTGQSSTTAAPGKRIGIDDAITVYLRKSHRVGQTESGRIVTSEGSTSLVGAL